MELYITLSRHVPEMYMQSQCRLRYIQLDIAVIYFSTDSYCFSTFKTHLSSFYSSPMIFLSSRYSLQLHLTRPKPVGHGYVFSMAVGTMGEWLKLVLFLLGDEHLILRGMGAGSFIK